jgi:hypothetical protein
MWHFRLSVVREKFAEGEKARKIDKKTVIEHYAQSPFLLSTACFITEPAPEPPFLETFARLRAAE